MVGLLNLGLLMFKWTNGMDTNLHTKLNNSQILKHIQTL
jgi:hypothetical protein